MTRFAPRATSAASGAIPFTQVVEPTRDEAVEVLYRRHYPELLRLAYGLVGERTQAEDTVQDAYVALYRHWHRLGDPGAALAYLRAAVFNRSRSRLRDRIRHRKAPLFLMPEVAGDDVEGGTAGDTGPAGANGRDVRPDVAMTSPGQPKCRSIGERQESA